MTSNLPPYSTLRTILKGQQMTFPHVKSFGNVLSFTPPGFKQELNVKFPDSRLPVCVSCKKNFKTKDMCRVRNLHTGPPWTTAYICMTLDASCTDEDGKYVDKPFVVRMAQWRPYSVMEDFPSNSKTPVCATCKKTNRTRSFCRDRHKHRKLPWCTVYVMLSTQESADPSTVVAAPSRKIETIIDPDVENKKVKMNTSKLSSSNKHLASTTQKDTLQSSGTVTDIDEESIATGKTSTGDKKVSQHFSPGASDDINDIPESRTMLIQINDEETIISWLKFSHDDDNIIKGVWPPQAQGNHQHLKCIPPGSTLIRSAQGRKYSFPTVVPTPARVLTRDMESATQFNASHDVYHQYNIGGYTTTTGQPLAPALPHSYPYGQTHPIYNGHIWSYPKSAIPPYQGKNVPNPYITAQKRPISPTTAISSPAGIRISECTPLPSVTAGEAAAMRRKKLRRDIEVEHNSDSLHPYPSPPPPQPAPIVPQLHHPTMNYGQVSLVPGPLPIHQQPQHPQTQFHQEQQPWIVYQQMYQAQIHPMKTRYSNDPSRMSVRTPESVSRKYHQHDESPNNVTMTPGPGDGGCDHDSDDNDFHQTTVR